MATSRPRYAPSRRALHWGIGVMLVLAFVFIEGRENFDRGTAERAAMAQAHFWAGIAILALMLPRLLLAFSRPAPAVSPALPAWQALPAKALHLLLYAMLVAQPVLGLMTAWTDGKDILLPFTQVALPALMAPDEALAHRIEDIHKLVGSAFYWVVGLHVLAALYHHFVRRDDTLRRMT
ncbi:cytochrome b [Arenimonas caeni]|uniref:Cytochrome B n=1 Tax=Arenimonas caeni TaxID=2058085 RepID=A0A2P6M9E3_9GAMM|nr:cytochrome b [Arenimonas caeni]PRH82568.1 cytochrome B [Arenimonas caeni]